MSTGTPPSSLGSGTTPTHGPKRPHPRPPPQSPRALYSSGPSLRGLWKSLETKVKERRHIHLHLFTIIYIYIYICLFHIVSDLKLLLSSTIQIISYMYTEIDTQALTVSHAIRAGIELPIVHQEALRRLLPKVLGLLPSQKKMILRGDLLFRHPLHRVHGAHGAHLKRLSPSSFKSHRIHELNY